MGLDPKRNFYDSDDDCRTPPVTALFPEMCGVGFNWAQPAPPGSTGTTSPTGRRVLNRTNRSSRLQSCFRSVTVPNTKMKNQHAVKKSTLKKNIKNLKQTKKHQKNIRSDFLLFVCSVWSGRAAVSWYPTAGPLPLNKGHPAKPPKQGPALRSRPFAVNLYIVNDPSADPPPFPRSTPEERVPWLSLERSSLHSARVFQTRWSLLFLQPLWNLDRFWISVINQEDPN